jgi:hypothetical protein
MEPPWTMPRRSNGSSSRLEIGVERLPEASRKNTARRRNRKANRRTIRLTAMRIWRSRRFSGAFPNIDKTTWADAIALGPAQVESNTSFRYVDPDEPRSEVTETLKVPTARPVITLPAFRALGESGRPCVRVRRAGPSWRRVARSPRAVSHDARELCPAWEVRRQWEPSREH